LIVLIKRRKPPEERQAGIADCNSTAGFLQKGSFERVGFTVDDRELVLLDVAQHAVGDVAHPRDALLAGATGGVDDAVGVVVGGQVGRDSFELDDGVGLDGDALDRVERERGVVCSSHWCSLGRSGDC